MKPFKCHQYLIVDFVPIYVVHHSALIYSHLATVALVKVKVKDGISIMRLKYFQALTQQSSVAAIHYTYQPRFTYRARRDEPESSSSLSAPASGDSNPGPSAHMIEHAYERLTNALPTAALARYMTYRLI